MPETPISGSLSFRLHHTGFAVADIQKATAQYVQRFGYQVVTDVIHDPVQTAFVQFLRLPGDQSFLEFVAPDGPQSKLSQAVAKGGGLNHLCYRVPDIDAATRVLWESGMAVLCKPVAAVAFPGRRISWLLGRDSVPIELVETASTGDF